MKRPVQAPESKVGAYETDEEGSCGALPAALVDESGPYVGTGLLWVGQGEAGYGDDEKR